MYLFIYLSIYTYIYTYICTPSIFSIFQNKDARASDYAGHRIVTSFPAVAKGYFAPLDAAGNLFTETYFISIYLKPNVYSATENSASSTR